MLARARARRTAAVAGLQVAGLQSPGFSRPASRTAAVARLQSPGCGRPRTEQPTRGSVTTNSGVRYIQLAHSGPKIGRERPSWSRPRVELVASGFELLGETTTETTTGETTTGETTTGGTTTGETTTGGTAPGDGAG